MSNIAYSQREQVRKNVFSRCKTAVKFLRAAGVNASYRKGKVTGSNDQGQSFTITFAPGVGGGLVGSVVIDNGTEVEPYGGDEYNAGFERVKQLFASATTPAEQPADDGIEQAPVGEVAA